ncbi:outer membrane protein [Prosthecodimorpha staleyi]|uniref:Outer membrane beta-barrel protein n=1 Tax=Prosthecodimorpha staleyi TaxID=2840188 RepID=A0A947GAX2_9HYPH|nr:outer membrane beta-barrel protein [Prosthecodimorpha staleyi]MBT9289593.1 outer membrane beta-barrel protein [Prosthecodimorpha staleyi]
MKHFVNFAVLAGMFGFVGSASAADLLAPARAPVAAPSVSGACAAARFSGFYAGVNAGGVQHASTWTDVDYDWYGGSMAHKETGGTAGVQVGYNYTFCNTLVGAEADLNWSGTKAKTGYESGYVTIAKKMEAFGTARLRAGAVLDQSLFYMTGGLAWAKTAYSWAETGDPDDSWKNIGSSRMGWVAGAGIEHALTDRISVKVEGLYMDLGKDSAKNAYGYTMQVATKATVGRIGLNYRF